MSLRSCAKSTWGLLGPGFVTGSSDDDPSGIATYSQTGAQFGYSQLWLALWMLPFMVAIQEVCGRVGMVTGRGLASVLREHYPRHMLYGAVVLLVIANTVNIGADLGAMAATGQLLLGMPFAAWLAIIVTVTLLLEVFVPYPVYARLLKWAALSLLAYVLVAFLVKNDWGAVAFRSVIPYFHWSTDYVLNVVAVLGTTITPYCFFWQADQEAEEGFARGRVQFIGQGIPTLAKGDLRNMRADTFVGMGFSNVIQWFIILTCASTLNVHGITNIQTADQAAEALRPLTGDLTYALFAVGIMGIGIMAVPILSGSAAYALSEALGRKASLNYTFRQAPTFYAVIALATVVGVTVNFVGIKPFQMLYYSAVINGIIAPFLMAMIMLVGNNKRVMGEHVNSRSVGLFGWAITVIMGCCAAALAAALISGQVT
jgi:NRAMP (natural resistance-associated macrophage protein)-like metal ion transporter